MDQVGLWMPRPYASFDRRLVMSQLSPVLSDLYPGATKWLDRRLDDVEYGTAACRLIRSGASLKGVTIETPKGQNRLKLSTLWVGSDYRRMGIGRALLDACRVRWVERGLESVTLTADTSAASDLGVLLRRSGFTVAKIERDRYGEGRHEVIFEWLPVRDPLVDAPAAAMSPAVSPSA